MMWSLNKKYSILHNLGAFSEPEILLIHSQKRLLSRKDRDRTFLFILIFKTNKCASSLHSPLKPGL